MDRHRRRALAAAGLVIALACVALGAYAIGGAKRAENVTLCAKGKKVSLGSKGKCPKGRKKLTIAKQGPPGPAGPAGAQGAPGQNGDDGTPADVAPEPKRLVSPAQPVSAGVCGPSNPGVFCGAPGFSGLWTNLPSALGGDGPPVSYQKDAGGFVHLEGEAWSGGGDPGGPDTSKIFYLPPGYRPTSGSVEFSTVNCGGTTTVEIFADGGVVPGSGCLFLDGISFHP